MSKEEDKIRMIRDEELVQWLRPHSDFSGDLDLIPSIYTVTHSGL